MGLSSYGSRLSPYALRCAALVARRVDISRTPIFNLGVHRMILVPPDAADVAREQMQRHRWCRRRRADAVNIVVGRDQVVEVSGCQLTHIADLQRGVSRSMCPGQAVDALFLRALID